MGCLSAVSLYHCGRLLERVTLLYCVWFCDVVGKHPETEPEVSSNYTNTCLVLRAFKLNEKIVK